MPGRRPRSWPRPVVPLALAALLCALPSGALAAPGPEDPPEDPAGSAAPVELPAAHAPRPEAPAAHAPRPEAPAARALGELRTLYQRIGAAEEAQRATEEQLEAQQGRVVQLSQGLADTRTRLTESRRIAGLLAREEYRGGGPGVSPLARLLLGGDEDPVVGLHRQFVLERAATSQAALLESLERDERRSRKLAGQEQAALDTQQALAKRQRQQQQSVQLQVAEAEQLLASLSPEELAELAGLERLDAEAARAELLAEGLLAEEPPGEAADEEPPGEAADGLAGAGGPPRTAEDGPSAAGREAVAHALAELPAAERARAGEVEPGRAGGSGASGGAGASALPARSWAAAGREIPPTSQRQWQQLDEVELSRLRPGDVVIYFPDATGSALYAGEGQVVQQPHPGAAVRLAPLTVHPVLGAVRPDPAAPSTSGAGAE